MLRKILKEGGIYTIGNFLTKGMSLLLLPFYTAQFSTSDYGIIEILMVGSALLNAVLSLQLYQGVSRYLPEPTLKEGDKIKISSTALLFIIFSFSVGSFFLILFDGYFIEVLSSSSRVDHLTFKLAVFSVAINAVFYSLGIQLRFLRKVTLHTITTFAHATMSILLTILLVAVYDTGIDGIYIATLIVSPVIILVQLMALKNHLRIYFGWTQFKKLLNFSFPLIPASMAYIILNFTDRIFVNEQLSTDDLGIYGVAFRFSTIISTVILGFSAALSPLVFNAHDKPETKKYLTQFFFGFFSLGTLGVLGLSVFSIETLQIFTQPSYYRAFEFMPIFYLSVFITGFNMFSLGLHIKERTRIIAYIVIFSALLNILLNYLLIPKYELYGAAFSTLIAVIVNNGLIFYFSLKSYPIQIKHQPILLLTPILIVLIFFGNYYLPATDLSIFAQITIKILFVFLYLILLIKLKVLDINWVKTLLKRKEQ